MVSLFPYHNIAGERGLPLPPILPRAVSAGYNRRHPDQPNTPRDAALYRVSHNSKHLADEFMADPFGRASPELQRVLMVFRGEPLEGKPVLVCTKPFEEWALAIHPGRR